MILRVFCRACYTIHDSAMQANCKDAFRAAIRQRLHATQADADNKARHQETVGNVGKFGRYKVTRHCPTRNAILVIIRKCPELLVHCPSMQFSTSSQSSWIASEVPNKVSQLGA